MPFIQLVMGIPMPDVKPRDCSKLCVQSMSKLFRSALMGGWQCEWRFPRISDAGDWLKRIACSCDSPSGNKHKQRLQQRLYDSSTRMQTSVGTGSVLFCSLEHTPTHACPNSHQKNKSEPTRAHMHPLTEDRAHEHHKDEKWHTHA